MKSKGITDRKTGLISRSRDVLALIPVSPAAAVELQPCGFVATDMRLRHSSPADQCF